MSEDFMTFEEELLTTTREAMEYGRAYMLARQESKHAFNQIQALIYKSGLHASRKSIDNKIVELLAGPYGKEAQVLVEAMNNKESEYKGLELVIKTYLAHSSALQSVIKTQISGEMAACMKEKYERGGF